MRSRYDSAKAASRASEGIVVRLQKLIPMRFLHEEKNLILAYPCRVDVLHILPNQRYICR